MTAHRYLILVSQAGLATDARIDEIAHRTGLFCRMVDGPLTVLTERGDVVRKLQGGALVGTLFHRYGSPRAIGCEEDVDLGPAPFAQLLKRYWGSYVAVLRTNDGIKVLRDPSGATPAHYASMEDLVLVASEAGLLHDVGAIQGSVDYEALARHIYLADLPLAKAPLAGSIRLSPGSTLIVDGRGLRCELLWNPWHHVQQVEAERSFDEYALSLSLCVQSCIQAWANCFSSILVGVSGGLDSSVVAACLAGRAQAVTGLTLVAPDPAGDERRYARALCEHLDLPLHERFYALDDVNPHASCVSHLAFPSGRTQSQAYIAAVGRVMRESGAEAFFTGNGGDNVFFLSQSTRGLIDRRRAGASLGEVAQSLRDICALTGSSYLAALRQAYRIARGPVRYLWRPDMRFLSAAQREAFAEEQAVHPWLDAPPDALPGKAAHIAMILRIQNHVEGFDPSQGPLVVNPLLSQPILEQCLAIPTWVWSSGGRDRAVARHAFRDRLPVIVADRRVKGGPDGFAASLLEAHLPIIRERLLGGQLAQAGIIDLPAVEQALRPNAADRGSAFVPLLFFLDIEAWIEHWANRSPRHLSGSSMSPAINQADLGFAR